MSRLSPLHLPKILSYSGIRTPTLRFDRNIRGTRASHCSNSCSKMVRNMLSSSQANSKQYRRTISCPLFQTSSSFVSLFRSSDTLLFVGSFWNTLSAHACTFSTSRCAKTPQTFPTECLVSSELRLNYWSGWGLFESWVSAYWKTLLLMLPLSSHLYQAVSPWLSKGRPYYGWLLVDYHF